MSEKTLEHELAQLNRGLANSGAEQQIRLIAELKHIIERTDLEQMASCNEDFAILLNDLVHTCGPTLGLHLRSLLLMALNRYCSKDRTSELTCIHVALAALSRKNRTFEGDHLKFLTIHLSEAQDLPPLGFETDVAQYFEDCGHIKSHTGEWQEAGILAALALSTNPNVDRFRFWQLTELIANGRTSVFPRAVWTNVTCPVVAELSRLFECKSREGWDILVAFCEGHVAEFDDWCISQLVRRALATYCVQWIDTVLTNVTAAPANLLFDPFLNSGISLNQLLNAGLLRICSIHDDTVIPTTKQERGQSVEQANLWLREVADISSKLQNDVYML